MNENKRQLHHLQTGRFERGGNGGERVLKGEGGGLASPTTPPPRPLSLCTKMYHSSVFLLFVEGFCCKNGWFLFNGRMSTGNSRMLPINPSMLPIDSGWLLSIPGWLPRGASERKRRFAINGGLIVQDAGTDNTNEE